MNDRERRESDRRIVASMMSDDTQRIERRQAERRAARVPIPSSIYDADAGQWFVPRTALTMAAPDLLTALVALMDAYGQDACECIETTAYCPFCIARAAIARATGGDES